MSDVHAVSSEPNSDVEEGHHQPPTNNPPVPTSSQRQNVGAFGTLASRNAPQVGGSSNVNTSNIRRSGLPQQVGSSSLTRRHSLSATDFSRINEEISPEARRLAADFRAALQLPPIDNSSPESALRSHQMQLTAMTGAIHGVFETIAQAEGSGGGGVTIQPIADTQEIRAAQADLTAKTQHAETLESDAQTKRGAATELRSAANEALEQAKTAHSAHGEAQRAAQAKEATATKAETAVTKAVEAAKAKAGEAVNAEKNAGAAQARAETLDDKADEAEERAGKVQSTADNKASEARDAEKAAGEANQVAQDKSDAATDAQEHADELRAKADQLAAAVEQTPEKERVAAQTKAVDADKQAKQAESAAKDAKAEAGDAAEHAAQLKSDARTLKTQAGELQTQASKAKAVAQEARTSANDASKEAATLKSEASAIGKEAQALKANAQELAAKAGPLRTEADKARTQAQEAGEVARRTKLHAQEADAKADDAEEEAGDAEDAARTAREDAEAAGRTLQEAIENAPVQTDTGNDATDATDAASSSHRASTSTNDAANTGDTTNAAGTDNTARTGNTTWAQIGKNWTLNSLKIVGQQTVSVGVTTALREAVGAGVEALLTHTNASDEVKAGIAGGLYGSVILANLMAMLYHERQGIGNPITHAGNIAQIVSLSAAVTSAATTGTLKDLLPSLMKTFQYSGGRDVGNLYLPLGDNVPEGKVNPLTVQAINSFFFYSANQMLVNSVQSFHGVSGAGFVDAMKDNKTDPNTGEAETLRSGFASLATYVVANLAGEAADQFTGRMLSNALSGGKLADLQVSLTADGWPGAEKAFDTFAADGVSRTSIFYTVYGLSAAANPQISPPHFGETGAPWLQNFVGAAFIALLCLPAVMTAMKNKRNAASTTGGRAMEEGEPRITSVSTPPGTPPRNETEEIALRDQGGGTSDTRRATGSDNRV